MPELRMIHGNCAFCASPVVRKRQAASANVKIHFCNITCKSNYQRLAKPVSKEWLYEQYVTLGKTAAQIGNMVKRNSKSVWNWLKDFNIPTRPRGSYIPNHFKKGFASRLGIKHLDSTKQKIRQARIRDGHVPYLKNGVHHLKGKRGADTPNWKGGITPERQSFYASDEWKSACKIVWQRTGAVCERCGVRQTKQLRGTYHIHHIVSFVVKSLRAEPSNLALLCRPCHLFVHSKANHRLEFIRIPEESCLI